MYTCIQHKMLVAAGMHTRTHIHTPTYTQCFTSRLPLHHLHAHICVYLYLCTNICVHVYVYMFVCIHIYHRSSAAASHACIYIYVCIYTYTCMCSRIYIHTCVSHIHIFTYIHIHTYIFSYYNITRHLLQHHMLVAVGSGLQTNTHICRDSPKSALQGGED